MTDQKVVDLTRLAVGDTDPRGVEVEQRPICKRPGIPLFEPTAEKRVFGYVHKGTYGTPSFVIEGCRVPHAGGSS